MRWAENMLRTNVGHHSKQLGAGRQAEKRGSVMPSTESPTRTGPQLPKPADAGAGREIRLRASLATKRHRHSIRQRAEVELLLRQRRRGETVEVRRPVRDEGEGPRACPEQEEGIEAKLIHDPGLTVAVAGGLHDIQDLEDTLTIGENPELLIEQVHIISQVTDFLVDIKALGGTDDLDLAMPLEFEPVPDRHREGLKASIVPDHADFINNEERPRLKLIVTDILHGNIVTAGDTISRVDRPATSQML